MKEYFDVKEYKEVDEFKKFEAEEYYKKENIELKDNNSFMENSSEQDFENEIKTKDIGENKNNKVKETDTNKLIEQSNSLTQKIMHSASNIAGTITASVAGAAGVIAICSAALTSKPKMEINNLESGIDFVSYDIALSELDDNVDYYIKIYNDYTSYTIENLQNGSITGIVTGLKPFTSYTLSLETKSNEIGITKYSSITFFTLKDAYPKSTIVYTEEDTDSNFVKINYKAFVSDLKETGKDYYLEALIDDKVIHTNNVIEDSYISSTFNVPNNSTVLFNVYAAVYDNLEIIGTKKGFIHIDKQNKFPSYIWDMDNRTVTATFINENNEEETETAPVKEKIVKESTCTEKGEIIYEAEFNNQHFEKQTRVIETAPLGHDYEISYEWSNDNTKVTATAVCKNDNSHIVREVASSSLVSLETSDGTIYKYEAKFENELFEVQYKDASNIDLSSYYIEQALTKEVDMQTSLKLSLNEYNPDITYEVELLNNEDVILFSKVLDKQELTIEELNEDYLDYIIKLNISYKSLTKEKLYQVKDLLGLSVSFGDVDFDDELYKYIVPLDFELYSGSIESYYVNFVGLSNTSEGEIVGKKAILDPLDTMFNIDLCINYINEYGSGQYRIRSSDYRVTYSLEITEKIVEINNNSKYLILKEKILAPRSYKPMVDINQYDKISAIENANVPTGYYKFDISQIEDETIKYYVVNGIHALCSDTFTLSLDIDATIQGHMNNPNPSDCAKTYNNDGTINIFVPTEANFTSLNEYGRVVLSHTDFDTGEKTTYYKDVKDGSASFYNLLNAEYTLTYYSIKKVNDIEFALNEVMPSGSIDNYQMSAMLNDNKITISSAYSKISNLKITYSNDSVEDIPDSNIIRVDDYTCEFNCNGEKTPISISYEYERQSTLDRYYWTDEMYERYGIEKVGSDIYIVNLNVSS